jgi:putative ABC transport system permease protein
MFGEENPIGQTFDYDEDARIVGVVPDVRYASPDREPDRAVYFAQAQNRSALVCLLVRAEPGATGLGDALRQAVHATDPTVPAMNLTTIDQIISDTVADRRFYTATTSAFAALALLLTATGLIVVVGRAVAERRREMAIRSALGARTGQLVSLVARQGLVPVLAGTAGGLALAWMGTTMLDQFLYQVSAREPLVYAITGALTAVVAGLACLLPARRLGRLQPAEVLRGE